MPQTYLDNLKEDFWVKPFFEWIAINTITVQIAYENQDAVGCIAYGKARDEKKNGWGEIISFYLLPEYFSKGIGQNLFDSAIVDMQQLGFKKIYLWVLEENLRAQKFYKKNNFVETDEKCTCSIEGKVLFDLRYVYE